LGMSKGYVGEKVLRGGFKRRRGAAWGGRRPRERIDGNYADGSGGALVREERGAKRDCGRNQKTLNGGGSSRSYFYGKGCAGERDWLLRKALLETKVRRIQMLRLKTSLNLSPGGGLKGTIREREKRVHGGDKPIMQ